MRPYPLDTARCATPDAHTVRVRMTPRGRRVAVEGLDALSNGRSVLKVRVRAAPSTLARALGHPASAVTLAVGAAARVKTFTVAGNGARPTAALARLTEAAPV